MMTCAFSQIRISTEAISAADVQYLDVVAIARQAFNMTCSVCLDVETGGLPSSWQRAGTS